MMYALLDTLGALAVLASVAVKISAWRRAQRSRIVHEAHEAHEAIREAQLHRHRHPHR